MPSSVWKCDAHLYNPISAIVQLISYVMLPTFLILLSYHPSKKKNLSNVVFPPPHFFGCFVFCFIFNQCLITDPYLQRAYIRLHTPKLTRTIDSSKFVIIVYFQEVLSKMDFHLTLCFIRNWVDMHINCPIMDSKRSV